MFFFLSFFAMLLNLFTSNMTRDGKCCKNHYNRKKKDFLIFGNVFYFSSSKSVCAIYR
jgi:hypothetical protein